MTLLTTSRVLAAHPLIADDTGTQGKGNFQLELNSEFSHEGENGTPESAFELSSIISYGLTDALDIIIGIPYQHFRLEENGQRVTEKGLSDISLEFKWRLYEKDGLSFALKPGITFPAGDDRHGLGSGRATGSLFLIGTKEAEPWAFHLNLGYIRNENKANERKDLWRASAAVAAKAAEDLTLVANIGIERNPDGNANTHPAFVLAGFIYSLTDNIDIDAGIKAGINEPETDYAVLAGLAWRF